MKTLTLNVPDELEVDERHWAFLLAGRLYEEGTLSLGQAAGVAGLSKRAFAERLEECGVSLFNHPAEDLAHDVAQA